MYIASAGNEIPAYWEHNPSIRDKDGMSVAMYLAYSGKEIPPQWEHCSSMQD